jgi:hypothetical protein
MVVLADLQDLILMFAEVGSSRALKGRALTGANLEVLGWIDEALRDMRVMLDSPQETIDREYARWVALSHNLTGA